MSDDGPPIIPIIIGAVATGIVLIVGIILLIVGLTTPHKLTCDPEHSGYNRRIADLPEMASSAPPFICTAQEIRSFTLSANTYFVNWDGIHTYFFIDDVNVSHTAEHGALTEWEKKVRGHTLESFTEVTLYVPVTNVSYGNYSFSLIYAEFPPHKTVKKDTPVCSAEASDLVMLLPAPRLDDVTPTNVCYGNGTVSFTLLGEFFYWTDDNMTSFWPELEVNGVESQFADNLNAQNCEEVASDAAFGYTLHVCSTIEIVIDSNDLAFSTEIRVFSPEPIGCSSYDTVTVEAYPQPLVTDVSPPSLCDGEASDVVITGSGFMVVDPNGASSEPPTVLFDDEELIPTGWDGCTVVDGTLYECTSLTFFVNSSGQAARTVPITITNDQVDYEVICSGTFDSEFAFVGVPSVDNVVPEEVCFDVASSIDIYGSGFSEVSRVFGRILGFETEASSVDFVNSTHLIANFDAFTIPGAIDVEVRNADSCFSTFQEAVLVNPLLLALFADPETVVNFVPIDMQLFSSGLLSKVKEVRFLNEDDGFEFTIPGDETHFPGVNDFNKIQFTLPQDLNIGTYTVTIESELGCIGNTSNVFRSTNNVDFSVTISPNAVWANAETSLNIVWDSSSGSGFEEVPRVYIIPSGNSTGSAQLLRSVVFNGNSQIQTIVPSNLVPGDYDLIIVNPSGTVSFETSILKVTSDPPPIVDAITPSFFNGGNEPATITGSNFDAAAEVTGSCFIYEVVGTTPLVNLPISGCVVSGNGTVIDCMFDTGGAGMVDGHTCRITVRNPDGGVFVFNGISRKISSYNFDYRVEMPDMNEVRNGHGFVGGYSTPSSRFLYAFGGTTGTIDDEASSTLEILPIDQTSLDDKDWAYLPENTLAEPVSFFGAAVIERFIYVAGGFNNGTATDKVWRSQILDPSDALGFDISVGLLPFSTQFGVGLYYYGISIVYDDADLQNPGGESIMSDAQPLRLPFINQDRGLALTLTWNEEPRAKAYRIYRTPNAGDSISEIELLWETSNTTFTDLGNSTVPGAYPLQVGNLGSWHQVSSLTTARGGIKLTAAESRTNPGTWFLHTIGGDDGGNILDTYEVAVVTVSGKDQTVGGWTQTALTVAPGSRFYALDVITPLKTLGLNLPNAIFYFEGVTGDRIFHTEIDDTTGVLAAFTEDAIGVFSSSKNAEGFCASFGAAFLVIGFDDTAAGKEGLVNFDVVDYPSIDASGQALNNSPRSTGRVSSAPFQNHLSCTFMVPYTFMSGGGGTRNTDLVV